MKAITIWQPWASLIACGAKKYETRSWATDYRGPIAIHAATRKCDTEDIPASTVYTMIQALRLITSKLAKTSMYLPLELLPFGCIIATAELVNCWHILYSPKLDKSTNGSQIIIAAERQYPDCGKYFVPTEQELLFGDWTSGRYAWELANVKMLPEPIPAKGKQRLWEWEGYNGQHT